MFLNAGSKTSVMRCFIALDLPEQFLSDIQYIQKQVRFKANLTQKEHLHLTLKFLGEVTQEQLDNIHLRLQSIPPRPLDIKLGKVGTFAPRIVWVEVQGAHVLQQKIDAVLAELYSEQKKFMGHVTFARTEEPPKLTKYFFKKKVLRAPSFSLIESTLTPQGPIYKKLHTYLLPA